MNERIQPVVEATIRYHLVRGRGEGEVTMTVAAVDRGVAIDLTAEQLSELAQHLRDAAAHLPALATAAGPR
jgi:hypothetical protein